MDTKVTFAYKVYSWGLIVIFLTFTHFSDKSSSLSAQIGGCNVFLLFKSVINLHGVILGAISHPPTLVSQVTFNFLSPSDWHCVFLFEIFCKPEETNIGRYFPTFNTFSFLSYIFRLQFFLKTKLFRDLKPLHCPLSCGT